MEQIDYELDEYAADLIGEWEEEIRRARRAARRARPAARVRRPPRLYPRRFSRYAMRRFRPRKLAPFLYRGSGGRPSIDIHIDSQPQSSTAGGAPAPYEPLEPTQPQGSEFIRWVQSSLNVALKLSLRVDGIASPETRSAIRSFQKRMGLPVDGIVGPETRRALVKARKESAATVPQGEVMEAEIGRRSRDYIRWVQTALNRIMNAGLTVDGISGPLTRRAVIAFQRSRNLKPDGIVGPITERALLAAGAPAPPQSGIQPRPQTPPVTPGTPVPGTSKIQDRTHLTPTSKRKRNRNPSTVTGLVLHQMAFSRGSHNNRYDNVTSHFAILPDGQILQLHPITAYLYASNGLNATTVAVEFTGNFPNTRGRCWESARFGCHRLTTAQIEAGRYLVKYLIKVIGLRYIYAHRQSSKSRSNDPGPDIWYHVGQWAIDNLGLSDGGPTFKVGSGQPIPQEWRTWGQRGQTPELTEGFDEALYPELQGEINRKSPGYIRWFQIALNRIQNAGLAVDGIAGSRTRQAVIVFQRSRNLTPDGIVGPITERALRAAGAPPPPGSTTPPAYTPAPSPPPTPSPAVSVMTGFRPSLNGFRFANYFTLPTSVTGPLSWLGVPIGSGAYGLCGGMSFLAGDYYHFKRSIPTTTSVPPIGSPLYIKLVNRQLDSLNLRAAAMFSGFGAPVLRFYRWMNLPDTGPGSVAALTLPEFTSTASRLMGKRIVMLGLVLVNAAIGALTDNHQVMAFGITRSSTSRYKIHIYDPNYPRRDDVYIDVSLTATEVRASRVVPAMGSYSAAVTKIRGFFSMPYTPVAP